MANDAQNPEEEYHFSEQPEEPPPFVASESTTKVIKQPKKKRKLLLLIGLIVVAFCVYKLLDILFTARGKLHFPTIGTKISSVVPPQTSVTTTTTTKEVSSPTELTPSPAQTAAIMAAPINERLQALERKDAASQAAFDRLSGQISELQSTLGGLNNRIVSMHDAVQNIAIAKPSCPVPIIIEKPKKHLVMKKVCKPRIIPKPVYFVRAMIQGRAWLAMGGGGTLTVAVGDALPGYGTVQVINPQQGTLTTSAGAIIGYSPDDR